MSQYAKIKAQIVELQAQAEEVRRQEIAAVVAELQGKIAEYGLTAQDLGFAERARRGGRRRRARCPPSTAIRNPATRGAAAASPRIGSSAKTASAF